MAARLPLASIEKEPRAALLGVVETDAVLKLSTMFEGVVPSVNEAPHSD